MGKNNLDISSVEDMSVEELQELYDAFFESHSQGLPIKLGDFETLILEMGGRCDR